MSLCKVCNKEEATKTNSHILPHFLIKTAINKEGSKQRNYELTFSFSQNEFSELYFGQSILPETIEEFTGRDLTQEESAKANPFAQDFLFCPSCETYFGLLEEYYSSEVYNKLLAQNFGAVTSVEKVQIATSETVSKELVLLLIYSIFFRCSVARYHGFRLDGFEQKFRKVLNHYKGKDVTDVLVKLKSDGDRFTYMPFVNTFSVPPADDTTKNFVTILHSDKPFFVYLNNVTFHLYTKPSHVGKTKEFFYGMTDLVNTKKSTNFRTPLFVL